MSWCKCKRARELFSYNTCSIISEETCRKKGFQFPRCLCSSSSTFKDCIKVTVSSLYKTAYFSVTYSLTSSFNILATILSVPKLNCWPIPALNLNLQKKTKQYLKVTHENKKKIAITLEQRFRYLSTHLPRENKWNAFIHVTGLSLVIAWCMELLNNLSPPLLSIKGSTNTSLKWYCSCGKEGESEILLYTRCLVFINWCRLIGRYTFFVLSTTIKIRKSFSLLSFFHICYFRTSVWMNQFCWFYFPLTWHSCHLVT